MSLLKEFDEIIDKKDKVLLAVAIELRSALVKATPVDTSFLKSSWQPVRKTDDGYVISNTALYADIVLAGRRIVQGKTYGSNQLPEGIQPIIQKYNEILQEKLKEIK